MSGRLYRVVKRFSWIEGGRPAPGGDGWEGGKSVAYEPGGIVHMEDQDLESMYLHVDALDEAGRAVLKAARAKAKASLRCSASADLSSRDVEFLTRALDEKRRRHGSELVQDIGVLRDGSELAHPPRYVQDNPRPGVIYGDDGLPDTWATARQRKRQKEERKLARIEAGAERGRRKSQETKRADAAHAGEEILSAVRAYRAKHPNHGGPAIAAALVDQHGKILDHADPRCREKAIEALRKRIERLAKSLDT
jgi:hypothetical protein